MIDKKFIEKYNELRNGVEKDRRETEKTLKDLEKEYGLMPITLSSSETAYIDFGEFGKNDFFSENNLNFVIGHSEDAISYLFRIQNMFGNGEITTENANLFYIPVGQGLDFKYITENKIIMRVLYSTGYDPDSNVEIYKTYEYGFNGVFDAVINYLNFLDRKALTEILPHLFKNGKTVENGKELWDAAYTTKVEIVRSRIDK